MISVVHNPSRPPRGHHRPFRSATWLPAPVLAGLLLAACGGSPSSPSTSPAASAASPVATGQRTAGPTPPAPGGVFGYPLLGPQVAATASGVYVAWQVSPPGSVVRSELARVDPASGRVQAARRLGAAFGQAVAAAGALWVATSATTGETLLRLNPDTLALTGSWRAGSAGGHPWGAQILVVAGGGCHDDSARQGAADQEHVQRRSTGGRAAARGLLVGALSGLAGRSPRCAGGRSGPGSSARSWRVTSAPIPPWSRSTSPTAW